MSENVLNDKPSSNSNQSVNLLEKMQSLENNLFNSQATGNKSEYDVALESKSIENDALRYEMKALEEKFAQFSELEALFKEKEAECDAHASRCRLLSETVTAMEEQHVHLEVHLSIAEKNLVDKEKAFDVLSTENNTLKRTLTDTWSSTKRHIQLKMKSLQHNATL